jgi:hypothetical protein
MTAPRALLLVAILGSAACGGSAAAPGGGDGGAADAAVDGAPAPDAPAAPDGPPPDGSAPDGGPVSCGTIATFEDGRTPSREVHVATSGDDTTGDGTAALPYKTIGRAAQDATPGTAIRVHPGFYPGNVYLEDLAGTAEAPIWIGGAPGEARPVLSGGTELLHLTRVRYLVVHDLEATIGYANGINCDDGGDFANEDATRWVVFRGLFIHDIGSGGNQDCLKLSGVNDYFVFDSEIARCGTGGSAIDQVGCHRGLIARSSLHEVGDDAVQAKGGSADVEIRWNRIVNGGNRAVNLGGSTDLGLFRPPLSTTAPNAEARNLRVVANLFVGAYATIAYVGCVDCLVANNTIVNPSHWIIRILQETTTGGGYEFLPASNGVFADNLVVFTRSMLATYVNIGPGTAPETFTFSHDLWYAQDDPAQSSPAADLPVTEDSPIVGRAPELVDPANGDYAISGASPAAGAGVAIPGVTGDLAGACYRDPPSIGAWEAP